MKIKTLIAICLMAVTFTNCKKGDTGPAGKDGTNGNANVQSVTLNANSWTWDNTNQYSYVTFSNISILTSEVVNDGAVMLYEGNSGAYTALPYTIGIGMPSNQTLISRYTYAINSIIITVELSDGLNPTPSPKQYKLVCIPKSAKMTNPNVNWENYSEVKQVLNLKD